MNLHGQIFNLPCVQPDNVGSAEMPAYKIGHRDARHAAAELALRYVELADAVRAVLVWRHDTPTTGHIRDNDASRDALKVMAEAFSAIDA